MFLHQTSDPDKAHRLLKAAFDELKKEELPEIIHALYHMYSLTPPRKRPSTAAEVARNYLINENLRPRLRPNPPVPAVPPAV